MQPPDTDPDRAMERPATTMNDARTPSVPIGRESEAPTPAMQQYLEQKRRVGDAVLLFRMGDFYETFYDDAVLCANVLGIALTSRNKGENPIPLAGIPYHALDGYLRRLVAAGYKVAISEQMEDPRSAKGVIRRDIVRIVTAGTLTDEGLLDHRSDNALVCLCTQGGKPGLAVVELASGRFEIVNVDADALLDELVRLRPAELLIEDERGSSSEQTAQRLRELIDVTVTRRPSTEFSNFRAQQVLLEHFHAASLEAFGVEGMDGSVRAAGAALQYLRETQRATLTHLGALRRRDASDCMHLDHATFRSLEIERTMRTGQREGSLLHAVDRTVHPMGARTLRHWLRSPLRDIEEIRARQNGVQSLVRNELARARIRKRLRGMADIERITARASLGRSTTRDLSSLGAALAGLPGLASDMAELGDAPLLAEIGNSFVGLEHLADLLTRSLRRDPPQQVKEGGFIADGFDTELDRLRAVDRDGQSWLAEYQRKEVERTGLGQLKVGYNRVFGYFIELPRSAANRAPPEYVRKQTVKNAERYITEALKVHEEEALTARERANDLEFQLFESIRQQTVAYTPALQRLAEAVGELDCLSGLAELAVERQYVRPEITDDLHLEILDGRHPVLDQALADRFVSNDTMMSPDDARVFVITGPNMAGKSTYIRQVAALTLLAQIGSFVPARRMSIGVVDRLFARVGSADEIMRGQSTFLVEMIEAANILHHATRQSLVILDEIGRGTSTFDGLALAWAIAEHLILRTECRALIATHYHELIDLADSIPGARNFNAAVENRVDAERGEDQMVFLHRLVPGGASRSYGITVARLAGIPAPVIQRSREVLHALQTGPGSQGRTQRSLRRCGSDPSQLSLFHAPVGKNEEPSA